jgi:hypothetical protein
VYRLYNVELLVTNKSEASYRCLIVELFQHLTVGTE